MNSSNRPNEIKAESNATPAAYYMDADEKSLSDETIY